MRGSQPYEAWIRKTYLCILGGGLDIVNNNLSFGLY